MPEPLTLLSQDHVELPQHSLRTGMKLEMVSRWEQLQICPVSVTRVSRAEVLPPETPLGLVASSVLTPPPPPPQVYNDVYFQVTLDDVSGDATPRRVLCHADTPGILPVQWCLKNGVGLERPRGFEGQDFDWADYLKQSGTEAAPESCFPDVSSNRRRATTPNAPSHTRSGVGRRSERR